MTGIRLTAGEDLPAGAQLTIDPTTGHVVIARPLPAPVPYDPPHNTDLILTRTLTEGRQHWPCPDLDEWAHTTGPCPKLGGTR